MNGKKLKVLLVSSEIAPFAKTGGLADVCGSLPKEIKKAGHDIRLIMPNYSIIDEMKFDIRPDNRLNKILIRIGDKDKLAHIWKTFLPDSDIQVYFVDNADYFNRPELYRNPETNEDWIDNAERFIFFNKTILEATKIMHWQPDVIHVNDWQTSLIPLFLKTIYLNDSYFNKIKTLLTIHNIAYQGIFERDILKLMGHFEAMYYPGSSIEYWGKVNFLKIGIVNSDLVNTVSETYAAEIQTGEEFGYGLEGVLKQRSQSLFGILNGVDYSVWSPELDPLIERNYSRRNLGGKMENKRKLLQQNGLTFSDDIPVIGIISRLADQKGFDLIADIFHELMKMELQIILLGTGDAKYHALFSKYATKYPDKFRIHLAFNNQLAHLIEAGADMFLMPSKYEPCGLNQIYSMKYGTIPIVRETGGLKDTVHQFEEKTLAGTGFLFKEYDSKALLTTIKRATNVFQNKAAWRKLIQNSMDQDYSWERSSRQYIDLYNKLISH